jgi:hypothetical protein
VSIAIESRREHCGLGEPPISSHASGANGGWLEASLTFLSIQNILSYSHFTGSRKTMVQHDQQLLKTKEKAILYLSVAIYTFIIIGFYFHSSNRPQFFGKYDLKYLFFLTVISTSVPYVFLLFQFLLSKTNIKIRGDSVILTPSVKVLSFVVLIVFILIVDDVIFYFATNNEQHLRQNLQSFHPSLLVQPIRGDKEKNINRWGFRGEDIEKEKPIESFRIFMLGGSTVFSGEVKFEQSHPRLLEHYLRKHYPKIKIEVQNAGMHWHSSQESLIKFLTKIEDFHLDLAIVWHAVNDLYRSFSPKDFSIGPYQSDYSHYYGPLQGMIRSYRNSYKTRVGSLSYLVDLGKNYWFSDLKQAYQPISVESFRSLPSFERNMRNIVQIAKLKNVYIILASEPFLYHIDLSDKEKKKIQFDDLFMTEDGKKPDMISIIHGMNLFNETARNIAMENEVPFFDLEKVVPKTLDYFLDDVHYTEKGNKIIAEKLSEFVIQTKIIDKKVNELQNKILSN